MNRETKRMMQRQGALGPDGAPAAGGAPRPAAGGGPGNRRPGGPERPGIPERTVEYVREVRSELQKVAWPGRSEVANYTVVVLITVVLLTLFVFGLDYAFAKGIIYLFRT
ncbi:MAG: preprotein translocase subunit SecE [Acidimicrobiales bacterium]